MRSKSNLRTKAEKESTQSGKLSNLRNRIKGLLYVPAGELIPNDDNFRGHPEDQRKVLDAAMTTIGIVGACVAYENDQGQLVLIDGHLRREEVDKNQELPVIVLDVNEKEARQVLATYDSVGALATINQDILLELLDEIKSESIEDGDEYDIISACIIEGLDLSIETETPGLTDPDDVPEPPEEPIAKTGDLWILGEHRLLCGDSTKPEDVERLMGGEKAWIMATDPPYGIAYDNSALRPNHPRAKPSIANDEITDGPKFQAFLESMLNAALPFMEPHAAFYFWHPMLTQGTYAAAAAADILIHRQIIWVKNALLLGRGDYHWRHELCFYGWQKGNRPPFYGKRNQDTIWEVASVSQKERKEMNHATPKPVALWDKPIENHTKAGEVCYEPFSGSGTQIIAAEKLGRKCYAMEIAPSYCDVAVKRWEQFTGKKQHWKNRRNRNQKPENKSWRKRK